jgi:hypothetical protein
MDWAAAAGLCHPWPGLRHRQACWVQQAVVSVFHRAAWGRCSRGLLHPCHTGTDKSAEQHSVGWSIAFGLGTVYSVYAAALCY